MSIDIRLSSEKLQQEIRNFLAERPLHLVIPGDVITKEAGYMRGHGTYMENETLYASVAGCVEKVNKLICVKPLKSRYSGEVGDVIIGRIIEVGQKRWRVETQSKLDSVLHLSSVNLPGGELRKRSEEDERMMRNYLQEGDLISAEVQSVYADGSLSLHTRSLKYGKLGQGSLLQVPASLVRRRKNHFHNLPCGASVIIGNNGYIWICPTINENSDKTGGFETNFERVDSTTREVIARLTNCASALAENMVVIYDTTLICAYEFSLKYEIKELIKPDISKEIALLTKQKLQSNDY